MSISLIHDFNKANIHFFSGKDDDLIKVVLSAVEENWLNQAPQPTLDKKRALKNEDSLSLTGGEGGHSESERETSCRYAHSHCQSKHFLKVTLYM